MDRYWYPENVDSPYVSTTTILTNLSTSHVVKASYYNVAIPSIVMQTCLIVSTLGNMTILSNLIPQNVQASMILFHWAELDPKVNASSRQFWIQVPYCEDEYEDVFNDTGKLYGYTGRYYWDVPLTASTSTPEFILYPDPKSLFGPSLNALEIYGQTNNISLTSTKLDGKYSTSPKLM
jgi:hypothetical protein